MEYMKQTDAHKAQTEVKFPVIRFRIPRFIYDAFTRKARDNGQTITERAKQLITLDTEDKLSKP